MLGPSDVRKNIGRLMPASERSEKSLARFPISASPRRLHARRRSRWIDRIVDGDFALLPAKLAGAFPLLTTWQWRRLSWYLSVFRDYFWQQEQGGRTFDFTDCALGNLLFRRAAIWSRAAISIAPSRHSANSTNSHGAVLLNITQGENLFLVAEKKTASVLLNEADIVVLPGLTRKSRSCF